jgi:hypothetical protein
LTIDAEQVHVGKLRQKQNMQKTFIQSLLSERHGSDMSLPTALFVWQRQPLQRIFFDFAASACIHLQH